MCGECCCFSVVKLVNHGCFYSIPKLTFLRFDTFLTAKNLKCHEFEH